MKTYRPKILRLKPNDVVVIKMPDRVSMETFERVTEYLRGVFPNNKSIILDVDVDIEIVREEDMKSGEQGDHPGSVGLSHDELLGGDH